MLHGLLLILALQNPASLDDLKVRLEAYWNALAAGRKASALEFASEAARDNLINRREPVIRGWKLERIDVRSEGEALVTTSVEQFVPGVNQFLWMQVGEIWRLEEGVWRVAVEPGSEEAFLQSMSGKSSPRQKERSSSGKFESTPRELQIHFLTPSRRGAVRLSNGTGEEVRIRKILVDPEKFEVLEAPEAIPAGESARLAVRYRGDEIKKDQRATIRIEWEQGGVPGEPLEIPLLYNYLSPSTRAFFGLTPEKAEALRPGEKLTPALKLPEEPPQRPPEQAKPPERTSVRG